MKTFLTFMCAVGIMYSANSATLVIQGKYQNKNVYILNSYGSSGVGFCAREIKVNGNITTDETNSSSFEIDLAALKLKYGESVTIEIDHSEGCTPKVLNIEDLKPKPTFEIMMINVSPAGLLKWSSNNETGSLPYIIEQFKWNKWVPVGEIQGAGTPENNSYSFQVSLHSGENKFRVKQKGLNSESRFSQEVSVKALVDKPSFAIRKNNTDIDFSQETGYELFDVYGTVLKRGYGKDVAISNLDKGKYYLCYDNTMTEFKK